jgi:hypothetical protein
MATCFVAAPFPNAMLTGGAVPSTTTLEGLPHSPAPVSRGETIVDAIFIIAVVGLYAVTHWIVRALSRLGGME